MKALVIGGTGASGPFVVEGLLERGYDVTIFHSGQHEVEFSGPVEHIHGDPHFEDTMVEVLGNRRWDLAVATYGRLRVAAEVLKGRAPRVIGIGGSGGYARPVDPRWGGLGRPLLPDESGVWQTNQDDDKFSYLMYISEEALFKAHAEGHYSATMIRPPNMYGPGQLAPEEWCIIRRILDGRRQFVIADGGLKVEARMYTENVGAAILLAVDKPTESAGKRYNVRDAALYSMRQRIDLVARTMGHEFEYVDMPFEFARPCHPLWRHRSPHLAIDDNLFRSELGYEDVVPADRAIEKTVNYLLEHRPEPGGEAELQLGDPFDYAGEDRLIAAWKECGATMGAVPYELPVPAHRYRHPKEKNATWQRPDTSSYGTVLPGT